jgi:hypothetical protein
MAGEKSKQKLYNVARIFQTPFYLFLWSFSHRFGQKLTTNFNDRWHVWRFRSTFMPGTNNCMKRSCNSATKQKTL